MLGFVRRVEKLVTMPELVPRLIQQQLKREAEELQCEGRVHVEFVGKQVTMPEPVPVPISFAGMIRSLATHWEH